MNATYTQYELLRLVRNKRAFIFSLIFPLALFIVIGGTNKNQTLDLGPVSIDFLTYYMVSMAGYGAMIAAISGGARIAAERTVGWNRQLRLTPLKVRSYFRTKVITSYAMALTSIALLYVAGIAYGVRISPVLALARHVVPAARRNPAVRGDGHPGRPPAHVREHGSGGRRRLGVLRIPRRPVVPVARTRRAARHRPGHPVVLAHAGQPRRHRRPVAGA